MPGDKARGRQRKVRGAVCDRHDEATMMRDVQTLIDVILGLVQRIPGSHEMWLGAKKVSILCDRHRKRIGRSERENIWLGLPFIKREKHRKAAEEIFKSLGILDTRPRMTKGGEGESSLKRKNGFNKKGRKNKRILNRLWPW